jgi:phosphatidylglycerophosphate synthase
MEADARNGQKRLDVVSAFWLRKLSPHVTNVFLRTSITPNQTTAAWGVLGVLNSYLVYRAIVGEYWLIPVIAAVYVCCDLLDCVDGEIARRRSMANPIGGKLLDGICHRAIEYSLLGAFIAAADALTGSMLVLPVAVVLVAGDAMYSYVYERRLTALRVHAGFTGTINEIGEKFYEYGTRWVQLTRRQKLVTVTGQLHNKSIYAVLAISYVSGFALLACLGALALYKNWKWIRLIRRTLTSLPSSIPATPAGNAGVAVASMR